jgi:hypothetical protein
MTSLTTAPPRFAPPAPAVPRSPPNSAPRQAALLHGERALHQAVEMRPREALPRVMLLRNLVRLS